MGGMPVMLNTRAGQDPLASLRRAFEDLLNGLPPEASPELPEAMRGFLAAIDYKDDALLRSRYEAMAAAFADTADLAIEKAALSVQRAHVVCQEVKTFNGPPNEQFDEIGKSCQEMFVKLLHALTSIKHSWVRLAQECKHDVSRASELESLIHDVAELRDSTMTGWPWTSLGLPPVKRKMVVESRAAYARGEGEPIQNWIDRETSQLSKG
jgi:hypothetical protein